jgi:nicotinate-nucleotide--dimethylbenzimidazole phosphoribosyltransferase
VIQLAGIQRNFLPRISQKQILCYAGDHGVVKEGVSPSRQIVTAEMVKNFVNGGAAISVLAARTGTELKVINTGMVNVVDHPAVIQKSIAPGTRNMAEGPAMSRQQALRAVELGYQMAQIHIREGTDLIATGEMGVGNTTAASAIYSCMTGLDPEEITGTGAGLPSKMVPHKAAVIRKALKVNHPDPADPLSVLEAVGGFELAAMTGTMLAGAVYRCPVVVDGFISGASAILAMTFHKNVRDYLIFSHSSGEKGFIEVCRRFSIVPLVDMNMHLGEGTGSVMIIPLIENSLACFHEMATFEEAGVTEIEL